ncbi:MAG: hydrogenase [Desulfobacterales bacterium]|nr:hydrogenase [Desulfobacterales bacterium]
MVEALVIIPFILAIFVYLPIITTEKRRLILVLTGIFHFIISIYIVFARPEPILNSYFKLCPEGILVLLITSFLFLLIAIYTISYLKVSHMPAEKIFICSMLFFLSTMTIVSLTDRLLVLWIAIEATTLASAPLIFVYRTPKSLEATIKYILICSVGIALALLGSVFIKISTEIGGVDVPFIFSDLTKVAAKLDEKWLKAGFIFILVGYGTKMGLAPMHTWLPDAHSEAPSPASALLSGVLLNCAYLGIFKTHKLLYAAGLGYFSGNILIVFGLISIFVATVFILKQSDYKRLLAYSSIENMGIIAFGTGVGGLAAYGAILHIIHHSLIKSSLFLSSGNIYLRYGSKLIQDTGKIAHILPRTFVVFFAGIAGISGFPPFGIFLSEFLIIMGAFQKGYYISISFFIIMLGILLAGLGNYGIKMSFDSFDNSNNLKVEINENYSLILPQYTMLVISIILCLWLPNFLYQIIVQAVSTIGGGI